mgnify:FL=1
MKRYLRLYLHFLRFSFSRAFEFRVDFWFRIVMDCGFYAVNLILFTLFYRHTDTIGGWTIDQSYIFISGFFLVDAIHMTVFSNNMWWLPLLVNKGDLDYYLVRPVSSLFFLSLREFAANSFINLLIAIGIMIWAIARYPGPGELGALNIVTFAVLIGTGAFLHYCLHLLFILPVFWLHTNRGLAMVFFSMGKLGERPDRIYTGITRMVLLTVLPFSLIASVPTDTLFAGLTVGRALHVTAVCVGMFSVLLFLWSRGLRGYVSASS